VVAENRSFSWLSGATTVCISSPEAKINTGMDDTSLNSVRFVPTEATAEVELEPAAFMIDPLAAGMNGDRMAASAVAPLRRFHVNENVPHAAL
jgi:hypothetical protein